MTEVLNDAGGLSQTLPLQKIAPLNNGAGSATIPVGPHQSHTLHSPLATQPEATVPEIGATDFVPKLTKFKTQAAPIGVSSNAKQLVVVVLDKSSSMSGSKMDEANLAVQAVLAEIAKPENKDGFYFALVEFSNGSSVVNQPELATVVQVRAVSAVGGTNFDSALIQIKAVISQFQARPNSEGWVYHKPHVLFLSDGQSGVSQKNIQAVHDLANVTCVAYGSDADTATLKQVATDGQVLSVGTRGGELRAVLQSVGKTLSQSLQATV